MSFETLTTSAAAAMMKTFRNVAVTIIASGTTIDGILDEPTEVLSMETGMAQLTDPQVSLLASDVAAASIVTGSRLAVRRLTAQEGKTYRVRNQRPDGAGFVICPLTECK